MPPAFCATWIADGGDAVAALRCYRVGLRGWLGWRTYSMGWARGVGVQSDVCIFSRVIPLSVIPSPSLSSSPLQSFAYLKRPKVLLLGARGFLGSYVLDALLEQGVQVMCSQRPKRQYSDKPQEVGASHAVNPVQWKPMPLERMLTTQQWADVVREVDVVINCVGILRQRWGERYEDIHHRMPAALAKACAVAGTRLLHTSALGLHEGAKSRFLSSKWRGEKAIMASGADYCIVRPSLIDGVGGFGASWLRMLARWPVHFVPKGAVGRIAAVQATDLGAAYAVLAHQGDWRGQREVQLGGQRWFGYREYLQLLRGVERTDHPAAPALQVPLPDWISRLGGHVCDVFRFSPFSYGHWILLQRDNIASPNALPDLLGRPPTPVTYSSIALREDFRLS